MRKLLFLSLMLLGSSFAMSDDWPTITYTGAIAPGFSVNTTTNPATAIIVSTSSSQKNCLTSFTYVATDVTSFAIVDGPLGSGTTMYSVTNLPAGTVISEATSKENALCGSRSTQTTLWVSSGTSSFNFRGYNRKTP